MGLYDTLVADPSSSIIYKPSCELLGPTALAVQALMGVFVMLSLLYKRHRERPVRPWRIWLFDISKQVVGQMFVHGLNVLISGVVAYYTTGNACVFYFLNVLIDTTLGVGLIYVIHHSLTTLFSEKLRFKGFESGVYGDPPSFFYWMRQAAVYVSALTTMKFLVLLMIIIIPGLFRIGEWLLSWTHIGTGDDYELVFVLGIFPIIMNVIQFWFIDSIVKAHHNYVMLDPTTDVQSSESDPLFGMPDDDDDDDDEPYASHDIENPRPGSATQSLTMTTDASISRTDTLAILPADQKSLKSNQSHADPHSYPPSLSSSLTSTSTMSTLPKPTKNILKSVGRRRSVLAPDNNLPTPSDPHLIHQPQPRIPQITPTAKSLEHEIRNPSIDNWADWDESGDWADESRRDGIMDSWDSTTTLRAST